MWMTTLCYIEHRDHYLMLHRNKKAEDINEGKWIGVGGKFADRESPEECLLREVMEETGYLLMSWRFRGLITFLQDGVETEYMCLYTADDFLVPPARVSVRDHLGFAKAPASEWPLPECDEGDLAWVPKSSVGQLNLWPGDRIFLRLLDEEIRFFSLKLRYEGDELVEAALNGNPYPIDG